MISQRLIVVQYANVQCDVCDAEYFNPIPAGGELLIRTITRNAGNSGAMPIYELPGDPEQLEDQATEKGWWIVAPPVLPNLTDNVRTRLPFRLTLCPACCRRQSLHTTGASGK